MPVQQTPRSILCIRPGATIISPVRTIFSVVPILLVVLSGCSSTALHDNLSAGAEKLTTSGGNLLTGAERLWPVTWTADYENAERKASEAGTGVLYLFTNKDRTRPDPVRDYLKNPEHRGSVAGYIPALLFKNFEPDRRYAEQFGVNRAPALIVLHPDGTYHALQGSVSAETTTAFLTNATPPGQAPALNPHINRRLGYYWFRDWPSARKAAQENQRDAFVVLERWMSRDWDLLKPMLERKEVYSRVAHMVHCRPGSAWASGGSVAAELGVQNLPAIVIVPHAGDPRILELPSSYEAIVRFADQKPEPPPSEPESPPKAP